MLENFYLTTRKRLAQTWIEIENLVGDDLFNNPA